MEFENEIFSKKKVSFEKLVQYGFKKENNKYTIEKVFMNSEFKAVITVNEEGKVIGKVIDLNFNDEYTNFRLQEQIGEFAYKVRHEYKEILLDIAKNCFENEFFKYSQANRITNLIYEKYNDLPIFPWDDENGVFKNLKSDKWYGIIMSINKNKLEKKENKEVEVLNVKLDKDEITDLVSKEGYYRAYHMNKTYWITIVLDDTLSDAEIMDKIIKSHKYTETINEWILPANTKYFDIINYMENIRPVLWKQPNKKINVGDMVYIYIGMPYSALMYRCEVIKVNLPSTYPGRQKKNLNEMELEVINRYDKNLFTFKRLNELGIKAIRGPRTITEALKKEIENNDK
ncbi:MAG: MmcQ/YjbR family DNA-binding protein [Clostridia bacterium]|nr:MmcQ/YjbR family DNA-binding protein [Clostridia bacterium]